MDKAHKSKKKLDEFIPELFSTGEYKPNKYDIRYAEIKQFLDKIQGNNRHYRDFVTLVENTTHPKQKTMFQHGQYARSKFEDLVFVKMDFSNSDWSESKLKNIAFIDCNLSDSNFSNTNLSHCIFHHCDLTNSNFSQSQQDYLWLDSVGESGINIKNAQIVDTIVKGNFSSSDMSEAIMKKVWFYETVLEDVNMTGAELLDYTFDLAILYGTTIMPNGKPYNLLDNSTIHINKDISKN
ncbi:MAG: pentapeptide repeat-containing protein [Chloroflexota bacterium]